MTTDRSTGTGTGSMPVTGPPLSTGSGPLPSGSPLSTGSGPGRPERPRLGRPGGGPPPSAERIGDGVVPAGTGQGYVLRRLLRRVLTVLRRRSDGRPVPGLGDLPDELVEHTLGWFRLGPEGPLLTRVREVLVDEERRFCAALERGRRVLARPRFAGPLTEEDYLYLHDTHGVPREVVALLR